MMMMKFYIATPSQLAFCIIMHNNYLISCYIISVLIPKFLASICAVLCHIVSEAFSKQLCTVFHFGKRSFACACTYIAHANVSSSQYYGMYSIDGSG